MTARKRELRLILRPDKVGHREVIEWLDELQRDGRGVSGLQAEVVKALASHVHAARKTAPSALRGARAAVAQTRPVTTKPPAQQRDTGESVGEPEGAHYSDPLEMAASRLEF